MKQYECGLRLPGLLLLFVCVAVQAGEPDWKAAFNQLPEDIQNRIIDEANKVYDECAAAALKSRYYDCRCVSNEAMRLRTESGPGPAYHEIQGNAFANRKCIDYQSIVGLQYDQCISNNEPSLERHAEPYCKCYAKHVADAFLKQPYFASEMRGVHAMEAYEACDQNKYLALALEEQQQRREQQEAAKPPPAVRLSPYPWEWFDISKPPQELHEWLLAAGFEKSVAWDPCYLSKRVCRVGYRARLPGSRNIEIDVHTRKGEITGIQIEAKYSHDEAPAAQKHLSSFVTPAMLEPLPGQRADLPPACDSQRTTCANLPDPSSRADKMPPMYHYFYFAERFGGGRDAFLHYEIRPRLRSLPVPNAR
ncbi:MAG TPA: hypothetical protein ENJ79_04765 [Gammaproteobacteria bacterium]|nr:hypothetical protein [Gammaproteobacteria bacterium]